jgi:hypothetical protein
MTPHNSIIQSQFVLEIALWIEKEAKTASNDNNGKE